MLVTGRSKAQQGLSLVELMIASAVGLLLLGGIVQIYTATLASSTDNVRLTRLNQNLRAVMDLMVMDIRRAGYLGSNDPEQLANNPFMQEDPAGGENNNNLALGGTCSNDQCDCITFSYDRNGNETVDKAGDVEQLGFRLNGEAVEMRYARTNAVTDTTFSCTTGRWQDLTEEGIRITSLAFSYLDPDGKVQSGPTQIRLEDGTRGVNACQTDDYCMEVRYIGITLRGEVKDDPSISQEVTGRVRVRNDRFFKEE